RDGRVVPAAIALSHHEQLGRLARYCPEAVTVATVTGDPSFDRLVAHLPRRRRYRRALGVPEGLRLVLVSSTWGEHSLYGANGDVLSRLLAELPLDEYRVALVTHPNIPLHHGELQLRLWLARERGAGLTVIPPERGWQAALIASGDPVAAAVWDDAVEALSLALATYTLLLDPEAIVLGGGLAESGDLLAVPLAERLGRRL
ncbi:ROK family protein, partial [Streptosporangium algeriense]